MSQDINLDGAGSKSCLLLLFLSTIPSNPLLTCYKALNLDAKCLQRAHEALRNYIFVISRLLNVHY